MPTRTIRLFVILTILFAAIGAANADFLQVSTSFGKQTALLDNSTHLDWLHLNFTRSYSYNDMQTKLLSGGLFGGWRYATPGELKQLFIEYDGSSTGVVNNNDVLAIQFMNDLGGPTYTADNPSTGFHREAATGLLDIPFGLGHADYGYIAIDNFYGASINPNLQGSTVDSFADFNQGHWLVRDDVSGQVPEPESIILLANGVLFAVSTKLVRRRK